MSLALMALSQFTPHLCVYSGYKSDLFNKIVYMSGSHLDADVPGDGEMYYQTSFLDSERKALSFTKSHLRASRHRLFTYIFTTTPPPIPICTEDATTMEKIDAFRIERQRLETPIQIQQEFESQIVIRKFIPLWFPSFFSYPSTSTTTMKVFLTDIGIAFKNEMSTYFFAHDTYTLSVEKSVAQTDTASVQITLLSTTPHHFFRTLIRTLIPIDKFEILANQPKTEEPSAKEDAFLANYRTMKLNCPLAVVEKWQASQSTYMKSEASAWSSTQSNWHIPY